jgi:hypothetical protein
LRDSQRRGERQDGRKGEAAADAKQQSRFQQRCYAGKWLLVRCRSR